LQTSSRELAAAPDCQLAFLFANLPALAVRSGMDVDVDVVVFMFAF